MYCPQCGSTQSDELRFCKSCGTNLDGVRTALSRETGEKFDWSKTWLAEMLMSGEESVKRAAEIERLQGKTPEVKRRNEIKGGVITASVGTRPDARAFRHHGRYRDQRQGIRYGC